MSVRFDAAADRLLRTTDLPDYNSPYTWMAWIYLVSDLGITSALFSLNAGAETNEDTIRIPTSTRLLTARVDVGGAGNSNTGSALAVGTWCHLAAVRETATSLKLYLNGVLNATNVRDITGRTAPTRMEHAGIAALARQADLRVAYIKAWSAALNITEVNAEKNVIPAARAANLYGEWRTPAGAGRLTDSSGSGRSWTEGGTLTDEDNPFAPAYYRPTMKGGCRNMSGGFING